MANSNIINIVNIDGIKLNLEALQVWIIVAIVGLAVVGLAIYKLRSKEISRVSSGKQFVGMGIIWVLSGLGYGLWRGDCPAPRY